MIRRSQAKRASGWTHRSIPVFPRIASGEGRLAVDQHWAVQKFVQQVDQITCSGMKVAQQGQEVLHVTERAVFGLTPKGLTLLAIAPGVDLWKDVLDRMASAPKVGNVAEMPTEHFTQRPVALQWIGDCRSPPRRSPRSADYKARVMKTLSGSSWYAPKGAQTSKPAR